MKKFIEVLKENGMMDRLVDCVRRTNEMTGKDKAPVSAISMILKFEMMKDNTLADLFFDEATKLAFKQVTEYVNGQVQETEKTEALMKQGLEFLEQGHASMNGEAEANGGHGLKKENEEALEDAIVHGFVDFMNAIAGMVEDNLK